MKQPYLDKQYRDDCQRIVKEFEDPAICLSVLAFIYTWRSFAGDYVGWTDFPHAWVAEQYHIGYTRLKAAIQELIDAELIECQTIGTPSGKKMMYRYDYRHGYDSTLQQRREFLNRTLPSGGGEEPLVYYVGWNDRTQQVESRQCPLRHVRDLTRCKTCSVYFTPGGANPEDHEECWYCYAYRIAHQIIEDKSTRFISRVIGETLAWNREDATTFILHYQDWMADRRDTD
jgi:hypothetical protein